MSSQEKIQLLEEIMELENGTLQADHRLEDYEEWDSLSVISYMALMDTKFHKSIPILKIKEYKTVADILASMD